MSITSLSLDQLKRVIAIKEQIASLEQELVKIAGGKAPAVIPVKTRGARKKRVLSPEGRAKIVAALKARWARQSGAAKAKTPKAPKAPKAARKKRVLSPEGRAKIVAALKARWAERKAKSTKKL
jgi:hypothetical protein